MHLVDIVIKYSLGGVPVRIIRAETIPNGDPVPQDFSKEETAISPDEAQHLLNTKYANTTKPKC